MTHYHFIYKITNKLNGHYYIGVHSTNDINDGYMGSGKLMRFALKKYGAQAFEREILHQLKDRKQALLKEAKMLTKKVLSDPNCYNLVAGGGGAVYFIRRTQKIEKIVEIVEKPNPYDFFDAEYEYKVQPVHPVRVANPEVLTSFGKAFMDIMTGQTIFEIITDQYNKISGNKLAENFITLLYRIPAYQNNIVINKHKRDYLSQK